MNYNKYILFICLVIVCLVIIHYNSKIQLKKLITIHQVEHILIDNITHLKKTNMPIVIKFKEVFYNINLNRLKTQNPSNVIIDTKIKKVELTSDILPSINIINRFKNLLNIQSKYFLYLLPINTKSQYLKSNVSENIFILEKGKVIFRLFHPTNLSFFNFIKKNNINYHYKLTTNLSNNIMPTYIDIILHKNQGLYIPYNWIYQLIIFEPSLLINYQYIDLFSKIAFLCLT